MSLTLVAQLVADADLLTALGAEASLTFDALLAPDAAAYLDVAGPNIVVTLGPYIEVLGGTADAHYTHTQVSPASTWVVTHNLGKYPSVTVVDSAGDEVEGAATFDSINQVTLNFSAGFAGMAFIN